MWLLQGPWGILGCLCLVPRTGSGRGGLASEIGAAALRARRRDGAACQVAPAWDARVDWPLNGGHCRVHGGLSTGLKTVAGRAAIADSNRWRAARRRRGETAA